MTTNPNSGPNYERKLYEACSGDPGVKDRYNTSGDEDLPTTPHSHRRGAESLGSLKEPWVPAPGRSTRMPMAIHHKHSSPNDPILHEKCVSNPEMPVSAKSSSSSLLAKAYSSHSKPKRERGRVTKRNAGERSLSGYKLQTKDSLVDIAAHLQAQREEVLQLWQQSLPNNEPEVLAELEKANLLALEATTEVAKLRDAIQDLKDKGKMLSDADTKSLDNIRHQIFVKLNDFQASQSQIKLNTQKSHESSVHRQSHASQAAAVAVETAPSLTEIEPIPIKPSSSIIYLKEKSSCFSGPETDSESEQYKSHDYLNKFQDKGKGTTDSGSESVDLAKLTKLYSEEFDLPKRHTSKSLVDLYKASKEQAMRNEIGSINGDPQFPSTAKHDINFDCTCTYYRDKIHELYKKLLEQECNYEVMNREIERIDSEKGFQIKLLKSNISSQLGDLAALPELMELSEKRLNETILAKFSIESSLQLKVQELKSLKIEIERLHKELQEAKSQLEKSEAKQDAFISKIDKLDNENKTLRTELSARSDTLIRLEQKLGSQTEGKESHEKEGRRNMVLEDKILALEHALAKEKKKNGILKTVKHNLSKDMARREEELLSSLEAVQARNRALQNQMHLVKSSYYEIFSPIYGSAIFPESMKIVTQEMSRQAEGTSENNVKE